MVRLECPEHPGGEGGNLNSAECSHAGLSPVTLDVVTIVQELLLGASAMAGAWGRGAAGGALAWGGSSPGIIKPALSLCPGSLAETVAIAN